jgi:hypothetical protein
MVHGSTSDPIQSPVPPTHTFTPLLFQENRHRPLYPTPVGDGTSHGLRAHRKVTPFLSCSEIVKGEGRAGSISGGSMVVGMHGGSS